MLNSLSKCYLHEIDKKDDDDKNSNNDADNQTCNLFSYKTIAWLLLIHTWTIGPFESNGGNRHKLNASNTY